MKRSASLILAAALCGPGFATPAPAALPAVSAQAAPQVGREAWTKRIRTAHHSVAEAHRRHAAAITAFQKARHRHRARGAQKQKLMAEREDSRLELEQAEHRLEGLLEQARRNGVPPGWLRDAAEPGPASPQP